jgi:hypothetical protein
MKTLLRVVSIMLILAGAVWFLQGVDLLPGSFMTGQIRWAIYGALTMIVGIGLYIFGRRR